MSPETPGFIDRLRALDPERYARRLAPAGAALCLLGAALGHWYGLFPAALGLGVLLVACLSRDDGLLVLGPFARAELVRAARRRLPPALWRAAYAAFVFAMLGLVYLSVTTGDQPRGQTRAAQMEKVAVAFFLLFTVAQFAYLAYLTVQLVAPVVAEERDAKRLDFLLVSDLRNREVLFGKAVGRLPQLLDPVLASLPILALLPLLGGIPPGFVVAAALATFATVLGLAGVSFFCSIGYPTGPKAAEAALGVCMAYTGLTALPWLLTLVPSVWTFPASVGVASPVEVRDVVRAASLGNLPVVAITTLRELSLGAEPEVTVIRAVRWYSLFQFGVFAAYGLMAARELRRAAAEPPWGVKATPPPPPDPAPDAKPARWWAVRPRVWDAGVMWYEMYRGPRPLASPNWRHDLGWHAVVGALLIPVLHLAPHLLPRAEPKLAQAFIGFAVWGMAFGMAIGAAVRANVTIAWEREKGTLEALMLTGLGCREILRQKWWGCVGLLTGLYGVALGAMAGGLLTLSLHPLAAAAILVTTPFHVAFAISVGMYFTVGAKNAANAGRNMLLVVGPAFTVVAIVLGLLVNTLTRWFGADPDQAFALLAAVLVPQAGTGVLTFAPTVGPRRPVSAVGVMTAGLVLGTLLQAWLSGVLWRASVRRFEREWEGRE